MTREREIRRYIKFFIFRLLKRILIIISPAYRASLQNQEILTRTYLMVQDLRDQNMSVLSGERLVTTDLSEVGDSHMKRYEFAKTLIKDGDNVLDIACGIGYGAYVMAENSKAKFTGVDISTGAIEYASKHFKRNNIEFVCSPAEAYEPKKPLDMIVSFETIEHLENDRMFIERITKHLKPGGLFICSTPNEINLPHTILKDRFHYRHYTPRRMSKNLKRFGGLKVEAVYTQVQSRDMELLKSPFGVYTVHVARKM